MDGRAGFAVGGFIAGAAAVAVACAVTMSNSAALADVPGAALGVGAVHLTPSSTPTTAPTPIVKIAPAIPAPAPSAEVVPAPEPQDVAAPPAAPATQAPDEPTEDDVASDALKSGSWDRLREWAAERGWSEEEISSWVEHLKERIAQNDGSGFGTNRTQTPARNAGSPSDTDNSSWTGWKRDQSPQPPRGD